MNLTSFYADDAASQGSVMEVRGPTGAPVLKSDGTPATITLLGEESDKLLQLSNQQTNRILRDQAAGTALTAEQAKANLIARLVAATVAWDGIGVGEDETPLSPEAARRLYTEVHFIRSQAADHIATRANFLKASPRA